jgi:hypothetical protein
MKQIMIARCTYTQDLHELFKRTALSATYATKLHTQIEYFTEQYINSCNTVTDFGIDTYRLGLYLAQSRSLYCFPNGRKSDCLTTDLIHKAVGTLLSE